MKKRSIPHAAGFTLVEIALSIAILSIAILPLFALVPEGLTNFRGAMDIGITTQIAQRVINDARQTDFDTLIDRANQPKNTPLTGVTFRAPSLRSPSLRYFDDYAREIIPVAPDALTPEERRRVIYQVNTRIQPQAGVPATEPLAASLLAPANLALVTVQIAVAPGERTLALSTADANDVTIPGRNLFEPQPGLQIYTYTALVGRGL
jgi:prepilin-type N-terminal cleavage/methylation domain-containing protein